VSLSETHFNNIKLCDRVVRIETISNPDKLFDELMQRPGSDESVLDEQIPYWAELWPSAICLSDFIIGNKLIIPGMKVLEIGCGAGLPGIVAGQLGAEVILSDYLDEALELAERNWKNNNSGKVTLLKMDWRQPSSTLKPDLILASDIAYERRSFPSLVRAFKILAGPMTEILVTEPGREFAQDFISSLSEAGLNVQSSTRELLFKDHKYKIHIHRIKAVA
jgi:predicted nicotinamide N-methyase